VATASSRPVRRSSHQWEDERLPRHGQWQGVVVDGGVKALEFYAEVFDATERVRIPGPEGTIAASLAGGRIIRARS
jgi:hypothetical protein